LEQVVEVFLIDVLLKVIGCMILTSLITIGAVWLVQAAASVLRFDLNTKDLALFAIPIWIGTLIAIVVVFGIDQNIKAIMRNPGRVALFHSLGKSHEDHEEPFDVDREEAAYRFMLAKQREEVIDNDLRRAILAHTDLHEHILYMIRAEVSKLVDTHLPSDVPIQEKQVKHLLEAAVTWVNIHKLSTKKLIHATTRDKIKDKLSELVIEHYETQGQQIESQWDALNTSSATERSISLRELESFYSRRVIERLWQQYLDSLNAMRVQLFSRSYIRNSALTEFQQQAYQEFEALQENIQHDIIDSLFVNIQRLIEQRREKERQSPERQ